MRTPFVVLMLVATSSAVAQDWTTVDVGTTVDILAIEQTSFPHRWIVGRGGFASQSDAAREVWTTVDVGTTSDLTCFFEPSLGQHWTGGQSGVARREISGSWVSRDIPSGETFVLFTRSSGRSWAVGSGGSIYKTDNGGVDWTLKHSAGVSLNAGSGFAGGPAWAVGDGGTILRTDDGETWFALDSGTDADLYGFREGAGKFAVGENGTIIKSYDDGTTWSVRDTGTSLTLHDIDYSGQNANYMTAVGDEGKILKSTDAGDTWCHLLPGIDEDLYGVDMITNSVTIAVGANGTMIRTMNGGGGCVVGVDEIAPPPTLSLEHWPNPLWSMGRVRFATDLAGEFRFDAFDVSGRRVADLAAGRLAAGDERRLDFDASGWPAGTYFLRLRVGGTESVRRINVVH